MGIEHRLENGVIRYTTTGNVEYGDGLGTLRAGFEAAARVGGQWSLLFDIRESSESRNSDELRGIAMAIAAYRHILTGRCAIVAADSLRYGLARMVCVYFESLGLHAAPFRSVGEAEQWCREPSRVDRS